MFWDLSSLASNLQQPKASHFLPLFTIQALNPGFFLLSCGLIALLHKSNKYLPPFPLPSSSFNLCSSVSICVQKSISTCPLFRSLPSLPGFPASRPSIYSIGFCHQFNGRNQPNQLNLLIQPFTLPVRVFLCASACPTCPVKCELLGIARPFNRDEIFVAFISSGRLINLHKT